MHAATVTNKNLDARRRAYDADAAVRVQSRSAFPIFNPKNDAGTHGVTVLSQNQCCAAHKDLNASSPPVCFKGSALPLQCESSARWTWHLRLPSCSSYSYCCTVTVTVTSCRIAALITVINCNTSLELSPLTQWLVGAQRWRCIGGLNWHLFFAARVLQKGTGLG